MDDREMRFTDWAHRVIGLLLGLIAGPLAAIVLYMVVHREYLQEQEKREKNRAGFDLETWLSGYIPGLILWCGWVYLTSYYIVQAVT